MKVTGSFLLKLFPTTFNDFHALWKRGEGFLLIICRALTHRSNTGRLQGYPFLEGSLGHSPKAAEVPDALADMDINRVEFSPLPSCQ